MRLDGLAARPELNGRLGVVHGYDPATERLQVLLQRTKLPIEGIDAQDVEGYTPLQNCTHTFGDWVEGRAKARP